MTASKTPVNNAPAPSLSLAASVSGLSEDGLKRKGGAPPHPAAPWRLVQARCPSALQPREEAWFLEIGRPRISRGGLEKTIGSDALKITLRLRVGDRFHLDQVDLCRDSERRRFMERAVEETGLTADLLKRDMGKLLLAVEQTQVELARPQEPRRSHLSPEEREEALQWLRQPNLIERLRQAFHQAGIIGEETGTLVAIWHVSRASWKGRWPSSSRAPARPEKPR